MLYWQGTQAEGAIAKLFVGKMKSYIKCVNVDYESSRIEEFNGELSHCKNLDRMLSSDVRYSTQCQGDEELVRILQGLRCSRNP